MLQDISSKNSHKMSQCVVLQTFMNYCQTSSNQMIRVNLLQVLWDSIFLKNCIHHKTDFQLNPIAFINVTVMLKLKTVDTLSISNTLYLLSCLTSPSQLSASNYYIFYLTYCLFLPLECNLNKSSNFCLFSLLPYPFLGSKTVVIFVSFLYCHIHS